MNLGLDPRRLERSQRARSSPLRRQRHDRLLHEHALRQRSNPWPAVLRNTPTQNRKETQVTIVIDPATGVVHHDGDNIGKVIQHRHTKRWFYKRGINLSPCTYADADEAAQALLDAVTG